MREAAAEMHRRQLPNDGRQDACKQEDAPSIAKAGQGVNARAGNSGWRKQTGFALGVTHGRVKTSG